MPPSKSRKPSIPPPPSLNLAEIWFGELIPDLEDRAKDFKTDVNLVDDELIQLFKEEISGAVSGLLSGIGDKNEQTVREAAHTLQGMGGVAGAPEISVVGEEFSRSAIDNDWDRSQQMLEQLKGWLQAWETNTETPDVTSDPSTERLPELNGRILVVDDEKANRRFLESLLRDCGAEVLLAENGEEALERVARNRPDVALVDVMMPGISGYEVCRQITTRPELQHSSVIMVTAKNTVEDIEHAFLQGAFDYIRKPFNSRELLARVRNALLLQKNTEALKGWNARVSRELEMAGMVQSRLFDPTPVFTPACDFRVAYRPSEHIGGDMFDIQKLPGGDIAVYVADVAGHGVGSALITTLLKGLLNEILSTLHDTPLHEVGNELHRRYRASVQDPELYATLFLLRFTPDTGELHSLSCGHHAPLAFSTEGKLLRGLVEEKGGMPIGMMPAGMGDPYLPEDEVSVTLPPDSVLYLYTDGLIEARDRSDNECGSGELCRIIQTQLQETEGQADPEIILDRLSQAGYNLPADDCTLLSLTRLPASRIAACGESDITLEAADQLANELAKALEKSGWEENSAMLVRLLATEHLANVVKHGRCPPGKKLFHRLSLTPGGCELLISDPGMAWDPDHRRREKEQNNPLYAEGGRGLSIINKICSRQEHFRRDKLNHALYTVNQKDSLNF